MDSNKCVNSWKVRINLDEDASAASTSQSTGEINREVIVQKRKDRRKAEKEQRRSNRQKQEIKNKLNKESDKVIIVSPQELAINKLATNTSVTRVRKFKQKHNLLKLIVERKKQFRPIPRIEPVKISKLNKGKTREHPKKSFTRLKRKILQFREQRRTEQTQISHNVEEIIENLDHINIDDKGKQVNIHSRRFRPYCDNTTSKDICQCTALLLKELFRYQKRAYEKNEIKARAHRRYVVGFKEVQRQIELGKLKLVIIAPDCEPGDFPAGLDDIIETLKSKCKEQDVPYLFSLKRHRLGYILFKKVPTSCVGILSYDGAQHIFKQLMEYLTTERENYNNIKNGV